MSLPELRNNPLIEPVALYADNTLAVSSSVICMRPCDLTPTVTLLFTDPVTCTPLSDRPGKVESTTKLPDIMVEPSDNSLKTSCLFPTSFLSIIVKALSWVFVAIFTVASWV
jgi:hypothetical protein